MWLLLTVYYVVVVQRMTPPPSETREREAASAAAFVPMSAADIRMLTVEAQGLTLRARRGNNRWEVLEPTGAQVPPDLLEAIVTSLVNVPTVDVVNTGGAATPDTEFGFDRATARVTIDDGTAPVTVVLGARNPPQTAIYARRAGTPDIVLLGLNVQYYVDLAIETLRRRSSE